MKEQHIERSYAIASEYYSKLGVNTSEALKTLECIPLSVHCWQGDDVSGFENNYSSPGGGLAVTGNCPGRARNIEELQADLEMAMSLIPGIHRVNLHSIYGDFSRFNKDRNEISSEQFTLWADWADSKGFALDFNASCFGHEKASDGWTLCSFEEDKRRFWVEHLKRCREIAAFFGKRQGGYSVHNLWIPDGSKDSTSLRFRRRETLARSLEDIYSATHEQEYLLDSVESKLFGIGSEAFVAGSYDFYLQWAMSHNSKHDPNIMLCLDMGHFHPTESVADKISAIMAFQKRLMIHVSRGIRWDSDHVAVYDDALKELMLETVRAGALNRTFLALDYFDASINRIGAWIIGARAALMALLFALLEPLELIRKFELDSDGFSRLALMENSKTMPLGAVWDYWCLKKGVPPGNFWTEAVRHYEKKVLAKR